ncbi:MAG TPA: class I SAM-dependent methyltransferase, partial [Kofleriaceae bacterium]|nr:class I SAM-dependent methyltransferase [Kofleriaceae bacterium]
MSRELLREWSDVAGAVYGSEDQAQLFYALIKMQKPEVVVELGTALAVTSFWMAQAVKENGVGRVFTVDNGEAWKVAGLLFDRAGDKGPETRVQGEAAQVFRSFLGRLAQHPTFHEAFLRDVRKLATPGQLRGSDLRDYFEFLDRMAEILGLRSQISFLDGTILAEDAIPATAERYPFLAPVLEQPIDLVFADCGHNTLQVLGLFTQLLPRMSPDGSIFFDSAATYLPSYLALQETIRQLNSGKIPAVLLAGASDRDRARIQDIAATRQFTLVPIVERKGRSQNSLVWIRMQPTNVIPYPISSNRGMYDETGGTAVPPETLST